MYAENIDKLTNANFNAKRNARTKDDFIFIQNFFYEPTTIRTEDYTFAESMGRKITMKVKVPLTDKIKNNHKVILKNVVYDIFKLDSDQINKDLYIYLEGGRKLEE